MTTLRHLRASHRAGLHREHVNLTRTCHLQQAEENSGTMTMAFFVGAAFFEIAGCFAFWSYFRLGRPVWTLGLGVISLVLFAYALTRVDAAFAGRAYAAYGGIYIAASLVWVRMVEGVRPDRWDLTGATIAVVGALVIIFGRRV